MPARCSSPSCHESSSVRRAPADRRVRTGTRERVQVSGRAVRRSFGGDDHVFVEFDEEMNLPANFRVMAVTATLAEREIDGVIDICPANVSYQVRFDPDRLAPRDLLAELEAVEAEVGDGTDFH
ncbi:MAG: carboxyltransferase domain-containing protein, partial [Chloroflexi bacterium]|nr:carboxyltransferase domain-containing protein [Chloroflexota bacterium]